MRVQGGGCSWSGADDRGLLPLRKSIQPFAHNLCPHMYVFRL